MRASLASGVARRLSCARWTRTATRRRAPRRRSAGACSRLLYDAVPGDRAVDARRCCAFTLRLLPAGSTRAPATSRRSARCCSGCLWLACWLLDRRATPCSAGAAAGRPWACGPGACAWSRPMATPADAARAVAALRGRRRCRCCWRARASGGRWSTATGARWHDRAERHAHCVRDCRSRAAASA